MKKMIHQFALEYASKSHLHTTTNGPSTDTSSSPSDDADPDAPLDLTVNRKQETTREPLPGTLLVYIWNETKDSFKDNVISNQVNVCQLRQSPKAVTHRGNSKDWHGSADTQTLRIEQ